MEVLYLCWQGKGVYWSMCVLSHIDQGLHDYSKVDLHPLQEECYIGLRTKARTSNEYSKDSVDTSASVSKDRLFRRSRRYYTCYRHKLEGIGSSSYVARY